MVNAKPFKNHTSKDKIPAVSIKSPVVSENENVKNPVSPKGSPPSIEGEVHALRTRNKILTDTLEAIKKNADEVAKKNFELVWFARNRTRYPTSEERKRIEQEYADELAKLHTPEGDYHHGIHSGILAASRMFQKQADILHINEHETVTDGLLKAAKDHEKMIEASRKAFPEVTVPEKPPTTA